MKNLGPCVAGALCIEIMEQPRLGLCKLIIRQAGAGTATSPESNLEAEHSGTLHRPLTGPGGVLCLPTSLIVIVSLYEGREPGNFAQLLEVPYPAPRKREPRARTMDIGGIEAPWV